MSVDVCSIVFPEIKHRERIYFVLTYFLLKESLKNKFANMNFHKPT